MPKEVYPERLMLILLGRKVLGGGGFHLGDSARHPGRSPIVVGEGGKLWCNTSDCDFNYR